MAENEEVHELAKRVTALESSLKITIQYARDINASSGTTEKKFQGELDKLESRIGNLEKNSKKK